MAAFIIPDGPLRGVRLEVAQRRWSRTRRVARAVVRRRSPGSSPTIGKPAI